MFLMKCFSAGNPQNNPMQHRSFQRIISSSILFSVIISLSISCNSHENAMDKEYSNFKLRKGEPINGGNFTGKVWLNRLVESDTTYNINAGYVTFAPRARTHWHYHPGGQILWVIAGKGLYQEEGAPVQTIREGDVVKCTPGVPHWHGAAPDSGMTHMAIGTQQHKGAVVWLKPVTDREYNR
jgi:quercetin dioxygenase-like cupin family protein